NLAGIVIIYNPQFPNLRAYDPSNDSWIWNSGDLTAALGMNTDGYHVVAAYSPVHNVMVFGGGCCPGNPRKLWRLNADRSFTAMPQVPIAEGVGIQQANFTVDPVTGNFLVMGGSGKQFWQLNPTGSGTWTQLPTPPAYVGNPWNVV